MIKDIKTNVVVVVVVVVVVIFDIYQYVEMRSVSCGLRTESFGHTDQHK
jgi:hypothetical protein